MRGALFGLLLATSGCGGYGLMQTAHTEPPGKGAAAFGLNGVSNKLSGVAGRTTLDAVSLQAAPRIGLAPHVDIGLQPWMYMGGRADVKVDVLAPHERLAVAPRAGAGFAVGSETRTLMGMAGAILSYRATPGFEPYLAATYADNWITRPKLDVTPASGESLAPRANTGDGLVQLTVGFEWSGRSAGFLAEYNLWFPVNNDPGDGYAFVPTEVFSIGFDFFSPLRH
jgi:hypothetical protein